MATYINWVFFFFTTWRLLGRYADLAGLHDCPSCRTEWLERFAEGEDREKASEAMKTLLTTRRLCSASRMMAENAHCRAAVGFLPGRLGGRHDPYHRPNGEDVLVPRHSPAVGRRAGRVPLVGRLHHAGHGGPHGLYRRLRRHRRQLHRESLRQRYEAEGDSYRLMLLQTLSDRLAEASAECLHVKARRTYWGYAPDEDLPLDELFKEHFRGIRDRPSATPRCPTRA